MKIKCNALLLTFFNYFRMWSRVDEDSNGTVDFQEFLAKLVSTLSLQTNKIFFRFQKLYGSILFLQSKSTRIYYFRVWTLLAGTSTV